MKPTCHVTRTGGIVRLNDYGLGGIDIINNGNIVETWHMPSEAMLKDTEGNCIHGMKLLVEEGELVKPGQVIAEWD